MDGVCLCVWGNEGVAGVEKKAGVQRRRSRLASHTLPHTLPLTHIHHQAVAHGWVHARAPRACHCNPPHIHTIRNPPRTNLQTVAEPPGGVDARALLRGTQPPHAYWSPTPSSTPRLAPPGTSYRPTGRCTRARPAPRQIAAPA
eukprot:364388-Chlamydomonas_euryale.AAC.18